MAGAEDLFHDYACTASSGFVTYTIEAKTQRLRQLDVGYTGDAAVASKAVLDLLAKATVDAKVVDAVRANLGGELAMSGPPDATVGTTRVQAGGRGGTMRAARIEWPRAARGLTAPRKSAIRTAREPVDRFRS